MKCSKQEAINALAEIRQALMGARDFQAEIDFIAMEMKQVESLKRNDIPLELIIARIIMVAKANGFNVSSRGQGLQP